MSLTKVAGDAILQISHDKTWPVKYSCEASRENPRAKFYNGTNNTMGATLRQVKVEQDLIDDHETHSPSQKTQQNCSNPQRKTSTGGDKSSAIQRSELSWIPLTREDTLGATLKQVKVEQNSVADRENHSPSWKI
ncbi:hypothetical protein ACFE04_007522 [Oxalis oulophora]